MISSDKALWLERPFEEGEIFDVIQNISAKACTLFTSPIRTISLIAKLKFKPITA